MSATDWLVIAAAVASIGWVNWYFFFAERSAASTGTTAGSVGNAARNGDRPSAEPPTV